MIKVDQEAMLRAILAKGQPLPEIAAEMGVACSTLCRIAKMECKELAVPIVSRFAKCMGLDYAEFVLGLGRKPETTSLSGGSSDKEA